MFHLGTCSILAQSLNFPLFPPFIPAPYSSEWTNQKLLGPNRTTLLASMCRAMPFSVRAPKETIFFDVDIVVKNKSQCGLSWSILFSQTFLFYCFCMLSDSEKIFERKVWREDFYNHLSNYTKGSYSQVTWWVPFQWKERKNASNNERCHNIKKCSNVVQVSLVWLTFYLGASHLIDLPPFVCVLGF